MGEEVNPSLPGESNDQKLRQQLDQERAERMRLEHRLREIEQSLSFGISFGLLASSVIHDVNNMLMIIQSCAEFLLKPLTPEETVVEAQAIILAANQGASITRQVLTLDQFNIIQAGSTSLNEYLTMLTPLLQRMLPQHVGLRLQLEQRRSVVAIAPAALCQTILNLVVNARDAMPEGGELTIQTSAVTLSTSSPTSTSLRPGRYTLLAVQDTGSGMDARTLERLFEPYFTSKAPGKGTGLGLTTVQRIVREAGGHIHVTSEPNAGTSIEVYLPEP